MTKDTKHSILLTVCAVALTSVATPVASQDDAAAKADAARETRRLEDRADIKELLAAVKTSGGTSRSDTAGSIEASLLTRTALANAAAKLDRDIVRGQGPVLIVVDDESLGTWDLDSIERRFAFNKSQVEFYRAQISTMPNCKPVNDPSLGPAGGGVGAALPILTGLLGVLQQKTELGSVSVTATSDMLARATAGRLILDKDEQRRKDNNDRVDVYLLEEIPYIDLTGSGLHKNLLDFEEDATCLRDYLAALKPDPKKPTEVAKAAAIKAVIDRYDAFMTEINAPDDAGESSLYRALRQAAIKDKANKILRLKVDVSGGTTLNRNNFFTLFGAPAVSVTGGIVVSYVFSDAATSTIAASGVMACPTTLARLSKIHSGRVLNSVGDPSRCY